MIERPLFAAVIAKEIGSHIKDNERTCEDQEFHRARLSVPGGRTPPFEARVVYDVLAVKACGG
jgi:hypothetical protein